MTLSFDVIEDSSSQYLNSILQFFKDFYIILSNVSLTLAMWDRSPIWL